MSTSRTPPPMAHTPLPRPILHPIADRSYALLSDLDACVACLSVQFRYAGRGGATALWNHRWRYDGPAGRTYIVLFRPQPPGAPPRISLLGPRIDIVAFLAAERGEGGA